MYLEGDSISTLKYSMLYLDSDMLFQIRYYIRIHILYLVRTDVPNWYMNCAIAASFMVCTDNGNI